MRIKRLAAFAVVLAVPCVPAPEAVLAMADDPPFEIRKTTLEIRIDGELGDPGWEDAKPIQTWFETRPGDNLPAKLGNTGHLVYDDQFLYAAFEFSDPAPEKIRAPLANRDNVPSYTDYGGVLIDANNDGRTAQMFLANARGIQYDAISSDASGEDSAPDFFWDSAAKITAQGWVLELRIPFSSLRYTQSDPEQWRILLYRNHPREFRYQYFSSKLPRDSTCFICNSTPLVGLGDLPSGSHFVVAPYATGVQSAAPEGDVGTPLVTADPTSEMGLDAKWLPNPNTVLDVTFNPDFSQIEADVPLISANERFALFFPEKRPFFLEGADLFDTPLTAIYTRSFASPRWGARATGEFKGNTYMLLAGEDRGGGSVIIPGSQGSDLVDQDQESMVTMGRFRRNFGDSFMSFVYTGREVRDNSYNRVLGPDFRWQVTDKDVVTGQILFSESLTPDLPDVASEWNGSKLTGHAAELWWYRQTETRDYFALYQDLSNNFRADNGFIPQVGVRRGFVELGRSLYPEDKPISRIRFFTMASYREDRNGNVLSQFLMPGFGFDGLLNSFVRVEFLLSEQRSGDELVTRDQIRPIVVLRPGGVISQVEFTARVGDEVDFANDRQADGLSLGFELDLRPTDHLELSLDTEQRALDVTTDEGLSGELFQARVARLRGTYTFNSKSWLRLIGQWQRTERTAELYNDPESVSPLSESFGGSLVFAYKLNWQSVLFVGYGDTRELDQFDKLEPASEEVFVKLSYAFQR
ncbi:MAG: DUF5916 domain-containing protein [Thermoanaerobaculia bacterium]